MHRIRTLSATAAVLCGLVLTGATHSGTANAAAPARPGAGSPGAGSPGAGGPSAPPQSTRGTTGKAGSGATDRYDDPDWTAEDAIRFWTQDRMDAATDPSGRRTEPKGHTALRSSPHTRQTGVVGKHFAGIKSVGALYSGNAPQTHSCTASVVDSPGHDLILTAGHCMNAHGMFVPQYDGRKSAATQPFGVFPVQEWFRDSHWAADKSVNSDLDFAFARVGTYHGKKVQDVVGANTVARTPGFTGKVNVIGYPMAAYDKADQAVSCPVGTTALAGFNQMRIDCAGMWGGVSGGPWFSKVDLSGTGTGTIVGNIGGWNAGGPAVPASDPLYNRISYSPVYDDRFFQLYGDAQSGIHTDHGPYQQPPLPYSLGTWDTWRNARFLVSGDFRGTGHGDMIALSSDGRATLYLGDGNGGFTSERQLLAANSTWPHAQAVTAGDFTGSGQTDLMVRWSDGEVTLYGDIGTKGLNTAGVRMIGPNSTWTHATQLAGRPDAGLVVRWSDGELTLYSKVAAGTFGKENTLKTPNPGWQDATTLTTGDFSGDGNPDLLVRWSNGALDTYPKITTTGLGTATHLQGPNASWTGDIAMTAGNLTPDAHANDLVTRGPNGGTTLYQDTTPTKLGPTHTLVTPAP
ncbi:FG-GAP-like repeat-containing protein [Streptomyces sp. NPDC096198]|uniref:FG-GAP-like repeat-containing protein n=1 Tax=Streptomyces sp. NPDC096198 TaxID=3366080 RepID=UPI003800D1E3